MPVRFSLSTGAALRGLLLLTALALPQAARADDDDLIYRLQPGDTLSGIAQARMEPGRDWRELQRFNGITRPRSLPIGYELRIPASWLKARPDSAEISHRSGRVSINGQPVAVGQRVQESDRIETAADATVDLTLRDGSILRIESASRLQLERLRRYHSDSVIEGRIRLDAGRIEISSPKRSKTLEIRSPAATAAVRGTEFRVGSAGEFATTEVLQGSIDWSAPAPKRSTRTPGTPPASTVVPAGFGSTATPAGISQPERLLPAPDLAGLPRRVETVSTDLPFPPVPGASTYRVDISRDERMIQLVGSTETPRPQLRLDSQEDGSYFVRVRPIAPSRLAGFDAIAPIEVRARPIAPVTGRPDNQSDVVGDRISLSWSRPPGSDRWQVQVASDPAFQQELQQMQASEPAASVALPGGSEPRIWYWRVASIDSASAKVGPFGAVRQFTWLPNPLDVRLRASSDDRIDIAWTGSPQRRYQVELARDAAFADLVERRAVTGTQVRLDHLPIGVYHVRIRALSTDGTASAPSEPQTFTIGAPVLDGSGRPVMSGTGMPVQSPR